MTKISKIPKIKSDLPPSFLWSDDISVLFTPQKVGNKTTPNRIVYQPMEGCDGKPDGTPDELTERRYLRFAKGGAGIVWFEATGVLTEGRANPRQMFINKATVGAFADIVGKIKATCLRENGFEPLVICQLTHSGRYSKPNGAPEPLIAYNNPLFEKDKPIDPSGIVSDAYLDSVGEALVNGARLAEAAGFDGADIKSCHRYLLSELLSAYTRPGRYGGSFENRTRLLTETVRESISGCGKDFIITSRFNAYDGFTYPYGFGVIDGNGITPDYTEAVKLAGILSGFGVPMLNVTMGNPYVNSEVNRPSAFAQTDMPLDSICRMLDGTARIKTAVGSTTIVSSALSFLGSVAANVAAGHIENGDFDFAGFGRITLAYPDYARDLMRYGKADDKKLCLCCGKCTEIMRAAKTPGCPVRDGEIYLPLYRSLKSN